MKKMLFLVASILVAMMIISIIAFSISVVFSLIFFALKLAIVGVIGFALYRGIKKIVTK